MNFLKWGGVSFFIHVAVLFVFNLDPWPTIIKQPIVYTVTLMPISLPEPEAQKPQVRHPAKEEPLKAIEKSKPMEKPKKDDIVEKVKKPLKKIEKMEKPKEDTEALKRLQEAIEEIRKKAALDEIQKRVATREKTVERPTVTPAPTPAPPSPVAPTPTAPSKMPPLASVTPPKSESKLSELYYSLIWAKIKEEWTLPQNLLKEEANLETIIVIVIERNGKIQKSWFEKKSGNALYDQMAMRALKKAEPLPPVPKELGEDPLEVGLRFSPDERR